MAKFLGIFSKDGDTFNGKVRTMYVEWKIAIEPFKSEAEKAPNWKVCILAGKGKYEIGAGWTQMAKNGSEYLNIKVDDPLAQSPIFARLVAEKDVPNSYLLLWDRNKTKAKS
jgi:uncharacterized protein (DUF736 family)